MRNFSIAALSVVTLGLAACSSSDDDMSEVDLPAKYDYLEGFVAAVEDDSLAHADAGMMTGTATLSGALEVSDVGEGLAALGDLDLSADFTSGTLTGSVTDVGLYDEDTQELDTSLAGALNVAGTISGSGLAATAIGTLSDDEDHALDLHLDGSFYDYEGDLATYGDVTGTIDGEDVEGGFAAIED
ncbi:HupA family protein [Pseudooceanicola algae]|uniref:Transferrin-binding protein B C-lobe/N-lobe beta barrel domain-containing protein n=1 Tax=Pseudooceanicola algae TaxID=1537215 RepID=A0A418SCC7_9RHOB|nr:hypothetical protein [Pseudooceanicola algae]QPM90065.1 hypothetical protein PSAL_012980 [Pseudooceanicola algae]